MKIKKLEEIEAWQLARELTRKVYQLTKKPEFSVRLHALSAEACEGRLQVAPKESSIGVLWTYRGRFGPHSAILFWK
jgi:hypothetical protein